MAQEPTINHGTIADMQVASNTNTHVMVIQARGAQKLSPAGLRAVLTALGTYYGSTLTAPQQAAMPDSVCSVAAGAVTCYVAPGTEATLAAALVSAAGANTVRA